MLNPTLSKKVAESLSGLTVDERAKRLFQAIYREQNKEEQETDIPRIRVSSLISKMSFYYEKIRNTVEYKEEHLFRKNAIERILKREIVIAGAFQEVKSDEVARRLLTELIRAAYLPNNKLPETVIDDVAAVIAKYMLLRKLALRNVPDNYEQKREFARWVLAVSACEIEELLGRSEVGESVVLYMVQVMNANIEFPAGSPYADDKEIQIFLSIHRNYFKFDRDMLSFILVKYFIEDWKNISPERIAEVAANITSLNQSINDQLDHPMAKQIDKITKIYTMLFSILQDVIAEDPAGVYNSIRRDPKAFPRAIKRICEKKYKATSSKLWSAAIRSIIYIFITKSIFVFILEIPAINLFGETVNYFSLAVNVGFPPLLLFLFMLLTPLPSDDNTDRIVKGIEQIMFVEMERKEPYVLKEPVVKRRRFNTLFSLFYIVTFFITFGIVVWTLREINFSWVSIVIFLFFLTLVSFFGIRIRRRVKELVIIEPKETFFSFLADFFYTPILEVGKFLSEKFSKINVFIFILDFIIEVPFKVFVEVADEWSKYVKERREEI